MSKCIIGVPKEVKYHEGRVGLTPDGVRALDKADATVMVETGAGVAAGFTDEAYFNAGAVLVPSAHRVWGGSDIIVKVKEPVPEEYQHLLALRGKTLFTYLHLAGSPIELTRALLRNEITAIAYETVAEATPDGRTIFPLLVPMSKIAGEQAMRGAIAYWAKKNRKPRDLSAVIIGGGNVGEAALRKALEEGVGFIVLYEAWDARVRELKEKYRVVEQVKIFSQVHFDEPVSRKILSNADIVIPGPMLPGGKEAPIVLTGKHFARMKKHCYVADVSIDQGGSTAWTKGNPTKPGETFTRGARQLTFSAVPNIPGSTVPRQATLALTNATLPYVLSLAEHHLHSTSGDYEALTDNVTLRKGLQTYRGFLTNPHVAEHHHLMADYRSLKALFCMS